jgi:hypothetical protein
MRFRATVNQHSPAHSEGWMISGRKQFAVGFQFTSEPWWLAQLLFLTTYLLTTHKQVVSR